MENLYYKSTRSKKERILSSEAIVNGIAVDGGLYIPESLPLIDLPFSKLVKMSFKELAYFILKKFLTDFTEDELGFCIENAYDKKFDTPEIAPLVKKDNVFFIELYHGATAAFKDMALSILPYLLTAAVRKTGIEKEIVIITATSGDTGKAALESFSDVKGTKIIVFYPKKGVSLIQERQMVTQTGKNTFVVAIEGNFDDAQTGVKNIFNDRAFNEIINKNNYMFSSANSINIGRLIPQIVYYMNSYLKMLEMGEVSQEQKINIAVPTGNFGNILASYYSRGMGLPVNKLICASNENNVLYDFITTGVYDRMRQLKLTISPSMDILISSNLERLIYDICDKDSQQLVKFIRSLETSGVFKITEDMRSRLANFWSDFATEEQTIESIRNVYQNYGYLMDTHTAVAYFVYKKYLAKTQDKTKTILASTASPFKFPHSVMKAIQGKDFKNNTDEFQLLSELSALTGLPVPKPLKDIGNKKILHNRVCKKEEMKDVVAEILKV
jgi:threonine synthase